MNQLAQEIREAAREREARLAIARKFSHGTPLDISRGASMPVAMPDRGPGDRRPYAMSPDPCPRCATRGTLGCQHQKPFEARSS